MAHTFLCLLILTICSVVPATTFSRSEVVCKLCDEPTTVSKWMSYGSYVYHWESKYDLVYFPLTSEGNIWSCDTCGYTRLREYFDDLDDNEKLILEKYLEETGDSRIPETKEEKLERVRDINQKLGRDGTRQLLVNRVLTYHYREDLPERAKELAAESIRLLEEGHGDFHYQPKIRLYLLGEYNRLTGKHALAESFFDWALNSSGTTIYNLYLIGTLLMGLVVLVLSILLIIRKKPKGFKMASAISICLIEVFLIVMACMYIVFSRSEMSEYDEYYNPIIKSRLALALEGDSTPYPSSSQPSSED